MDMDAVRYMAHRTLDRPLETVSNPYASILDKVISAVAIFIFTVCSVGYYAVYASRYFYKKKVNTMQKEVENAINSGQVERVKELFKQLPVLAKFLNGFEGRTPLWFHLAVQKNDTPMVEALMTYKPNVNADSRAGTPLAVAVREGHLTMVNLLLKFSADPDLGDGFSPPLFLAAESTHPSKYDIMKSLLNANASANGKEGQRPPLLRFVSMPSQNLQKEQEIIKLLIQKGAVLNNPHYSYAIQPMHSEFIKTLGVSCP